MSMDDPRRDVNDDEPGGWRWLTVTLLFLSSYAIMFAALAFRFSSPPTLRYTCALLAVSGVASALWILRGQRLLTRDPVELASVEDRGAEVGGYLATYLLPLVVISAPGRDDLIAYILVFAAMGIVYVRSAMVQVNPTLYLLGYRVFAVSTADGLRGFLLTRGSVPRRGQRLTVALRDGLMIVFEEQNENKG